MDHIRGLRFGPLGPSAVHLCIDMQRLFAQDSPWASTAVAAACLQAIDLGYRVVVAKEAVVSSDSAWSHRRHDRHFSQFDQVEVVGVSDLLRHWQ